MKTWLLKHECLYEWKYEPYHWINVLMYLNDVLKTSQYICNIKLTNDAKAFIVKKCNSEIWTSCKAVPTYLPLLCLT